MDTTTLMLLVAGGIILLMIILWIMSTYNRMVDLRNEVENQYQNLETQVGVKDQKVALVEQTDLAQMGLESAVYDKIIEARKMFAEAKNSGNRSALSKASGDGFSPPIRARIRREQPTTHLPQRPGRRIGGRCPRHCKDGQ